jgi:MFS family permease
MSSATGDTPGRAQIPWRSSTLHVILASSLIGVMGVSLISPVLPALRPVFGVSDAQIGLVITAYTLPGVFATPAIGFAADRLGRRRVLVPLLVLFGVAGAGIAVTQDFIVVLLLRFLQGIGATALVTLAVTLIGDLYREGQRAALIGVNGSLIASGAAFYPLLGGALASIRWNVPFLFFGISVAVGGLAFAVLDEPASGPPTGMREYLHRMSLAARLPAALAIFGSLFVVFLVFYGSVLTAVPLLLSDEFGLATGQIGVVLSMVAVASALASSQYGRLSGWRTAPQLVALGFVASGVSLTLVWLAPSALFVAPALLGFGAGLGIMIPSIDNTVLALASEDLRAGMMGLRTSMLRLGQTVGPVGFTFTAEAYFRSTVAGYRWLILGAGLVLMLGGGVAYSAVRR